MAEVMTATPSGPDAQHISWTLCNVSTSRCGTGKPNDPYPVIDLPYKSGSHDVIFVINDPAKLGVKFAPNALWMTPGKGLHPTNPSIQSDNQINGVLTPSPSVLIVSDRNDNHGSLWLSYKLNFVNDANQAVAPIDPDWHNGGTGSGFSAYLADPVLVAYGTGALLLTLLIGMWIGRTMMRSQFKKSGKIG